MEIFETLSYRRDAERLLTEAEREAYRILLDGNPAAGGPLAEVPNLFVVRLEPFHPSLELYYQLTDDSLTLLALVEDGEEDGEGVGEGKAIQDLATDARRAGIGWSVQQILNALWELFRFF
ncbi:MAG: hypothetical protein R3310_00490 [Candidatus Competibacteraceae bacterium]|nr:hypothetical protein [Candidatus Competibacteraceae bacterium]